ncbi:type II secretion system GspH family protein [Bhargavaea ginsengi]|uniref:PilW family protein n=1 Tax=Bhargavaea ginsengi TaxID=426757 RepID=UPI00203BBCCA|nr:type II secretion system protein [Bhargavaea ginsengi]MCM3086596.1 type II secretion system GspH family protein [Bhargavaea ginsengi]
MRNIRNQRGMTLVELIAALALAGMLIVIIMTIFSIGTRYQSHETKQLDLQQEMNLLTVRLIENHRIGDCYSLVGDNGSLVSKGYQREGDARNGACTNDENGTTLILSKRVQTEACRYQTDGDCGLSGVIDPLSENVKLNVKLSSGNSNLEQDLTLSRFKEGELR